MLWQGIGFVTCLKMYTSPKLEGGAVWPKHKTLC